jgi:nitroimidazol reductase NimA-like FMN-containing flavoprotein (pyridoxamine 5'-phosphate oxidase superfamily)
MSLNDKVKEILAAHNLVHIATTDSDGMPHVRGVDYAVSEKENVLYFITRNDSRKVRHITGNRNVAVAIDHDCPTWKELQAAKYLKGTATAAAVTDPEEMQKAFGLMVQKFPFLKDLPGDPSGSVAIRIELREVLVTDHTVGFGHTETIVY